MDQAPNIFECRRFPSQLVMSARFDMLSGKPKIEPESYFPRHYGSEWCGEWRSGESIKEEKNSPNNYANLPTIGAKK